MAVVRRGDDRAQVTADELGVVAHGLGEGAEDDAGLGERVFEGGRDRDAVKDRIHGDTGEGGAFVEGDAELLVGL